MERLMDQAAEWMLNSKLTLALTGAGISVESGIPDFRSAEGLWAKYDPAQYATITAFRSDPPKVWQMLRDMDEVIGRARPNRAHTGIGELERMGCLHYVITQNVDNLHQAGGSSRVIEYHGNSSTLSCLSCAKKYLASEKRDGVFPPRCDCGEILKPDVIFFGEAIPVEALNQSYQLASSAGAVLVVGTSAEVAPANTIPLVAKENGAKIIEINKEGTHLTGTITDIFLQGSAGDVISALVETIKRKRGVTGTA
jgi:NAD-dependent deacetylase